MGLSFTLRTNLFGCAPERAPGAPGGPRCVPARLQDGAGGDCFEAIGIALPIWAFSRLAEVQEPRRACGEAGGGGGLAVINKRGPKPGTPERGSPALPL